MISTDRQILAPESSVSMRMKEYGELVNGLHVILLSDRKHYLKETRLSDKVVITPTNSLNKFIRPIDAVNIGLKIDCNIVTTQDPFECGWVGARLKKAKGISLEVQLHTDMFSSQFNGLFNFVRKFISKSVIKQADSVRVVTQSLSKEIIDRYNINTSKVNVLPIFVDRKNIDDETTFDLHDKYGFRTVILSVARLEPEKNMMLAIKAFANIVSSSPHTGFVIVGSGSEEYKLREFVSSLNLEKNVVFVGWQNKLSSYYKTADIYLQTSHFEGYGLSLVEAGLNGLPVVTTYVGVAKDLDKALIASGIDEFVHNLSFLICNLDKRKNIGQELKKELGNTVLNKETYLSRLKDNWARIVETKI